MSNDKRWLLGASMVVLSLFGLFIASRAHGSALVYWTGLIFFAIGVGSIFNLMRLAFDEAEGRTSKRLEIVPLALLAVALGSVLFHLFSPWWWAPIASNWQYIDDTIDLTFWITGIVFVLVILFMAYCAYRFKHRKGQKAAYEPESKRLEWILTIVTTIGVAAMLAPGLFVWNNFVEVPEDATEIEVVGQQWNWSFRLPGEDGKLGTTDIRFVNADNPLGVNPDDPNGQDDVIVESGALHLPIGSPIKVLLRSMDVLHSFYVPEFRAKMDMVPGMITYLWFTPTRTGDFQILCAELCGTAHANMRGEVVIETEADFHAWLEQQQTVAQMAAAAHQRKLSRLDSSGQEGTQ